MFDRARCTGDILAANAATRIGIVGTRAKPQDSRSIPKIVTAICNNQKRCEATRVNITNGLSLSHTTLVLRKNMLYVLLYTCSRRS